MYGSFVVKFRNIAEDIEIDFPSIYFRDLIENLYLISKNDFKINILKKRENSCIIKVDEEFFLRITYFNDEIFTKLSQELFKLKLIKLPFFNYHIVNFISSGDKNLWGKTYSDLVISDNFTIDFYTPLLTKFGDTFVTEFEPILFFNSIYKENQSLGKFNIKKIMKKLDFQVRDAGECKVKLNRNFGFGFKGKVDFYIDKLDYYEKEFIRDLIKTAYFTGVGYQKDLGYGMYNIKGEKR